MPPLPRDIEALGRRAFDVLVVGGGINGTGVARDAARRGLRVALVEKDDFGHGTTGRSTRLVHGGLRYLAMYDFGLVRESLRERERLWRNARHLVRPIRFLVPFYEGQATPPWRVKIGVRLYDALAGDTAAPPSRAHTADELASMEPGLRREGLRGGVSYTDGQVELVERLCVENVLDAAAHGAIVANHAALEALARAGGAIEARVRDGLADRVVHVRARRVVNTTGPWLDRSPGPAVRSRMTKGVHVVTPQHTTNAILLFSPDDDRVFFSVPWERHQLVGTTDTDWHGDPDEVHATAEDVTYLQRGIRFALPRADVDHVYYAYAGIRSLVPEEGRSESDVSRRHQILDHAADGWPGLVSLVGGKITPYRAVCEEVADLVAPPGAARSDTADAPLPGNPDDPETLLAALARRAEALSLRPGVEGTLATTYGTRAHLVLDLAEARPELREVLCDHAPLLAAEIVFAAHGEMARTAGDVLLRRTRCGWEACEGRDALPRVLDLLDAALGRSADERKRDEGLYLAEIGKRHRFEIGPSIVDDRE
jgi:glycerol-3-phosphate dehydrogenase